jgi:ribosomal protein S18 acetylase RimI-like enzyme
MKLELRGRRPSDDAFIVELSHAAFSEYSPDARRRALSSLAGAGTLIATLAERPVGFAVVRRAGRVCHLDAIAVVETERGRGFGHALLSGAEQHARAQGARTLELVTAEANLAALELFLKSGYRIQRTLSRFYPRGQTAHVLSKEL